MTKEILTPAFRIDSASMEDIERHLHLSNNDFIPPLDSKIEIFSYSKKLRDNAVTFEAWINSDLVGLVAIYMNDSKTSTGFITNVSILSSQTGKGLGTKLLENGIVYAKSKHFKELRLEVSRNNRNAIRLYEKQGFLKINETAESLFMAKIL